MNSKQQWFTKVKDALSSSPVASNVAFGFILLALEKLVELDFECPCIPAWNTAFSLALFIIPGLLAFLMMLIIQGCSCDPTCTKSFSFSLVPLFVWVSLLLLDGQYFACAATNWEGRYVHIDKASPQKWCEPVEAGNDTTQKLMLRSQRLFMFSQVLGIFPLAIICFGLVGYLFMENGTKKTPVSEETELTTLNSEQPKTPEGDQPGPTE